MSALIVLAAYVIGSMPTAYIASRLLKGQDIRRMGDRNMGARNAYLELGPKAGFAVGLIDAAKGVLAVGLAEIAGLALGWVMLAGIAAILGHNFPVFLGFRGGRGEATALGVLLVVVTIPALIVAAPAIAAHFILRDTAKAAAFIFVPLPLVEWLIGTPPVLIGYSIVLPILVAVTHLFRARQPAPSPGRRRA
jgi:glycerol-3-phosphate acyltransferase PlsY